jgi:hypothetical protein
MRKIVLVGMLVLLFPFQARAGVVFEATGLIRAGNPATRVAGGVTETTNACGVSLEPNVPNGTTQGADGFWFQLPESIRGHTATLTEDPPNINEDTATGDMDVWFYDAGCNLIKPPNTDGTGPKDPNAYSMATQGEASLNDDDLPVFSPENGTIPAMAAWAIVDLVVGANATFNFSAQG